MNKLSVLQDRRRIVKIARQVAAHASSDRNQRPVVLFNASTRLGGVSQNAAFALLASWGLRMAGVRLIHFVCRAGMSHCVLGTNREDHHKPPPCKSCVRQSRRLYSRASVHWFEFQEDQVLSRALEPLDIEELSAFEYPFEAFNGRQMVMPLGSLVLPSIRWALRRHTLPDDEATRYLLRQYILSAYHVAREFANLLQQARPAAVVIFNGILYPEAAARWVAVQAKHTLPELEDLRIITHEVGFQRFSAFFTEGQATAYPIHIPDEFELTAGQNTLLDEYLEKRFQGKFTMAGIQFWPEMRGLDPALLERIARFRQMVPVFTNVVYDTSQVHANQVFPNMFAWLDLVLELIRAHPETLFVLRAHPDEMRPGTAKQSRESVRDWVRNRGVDKLENVVFIDSQDYVSSYELIQRARFVMVYNSSIGMEAALMGVAVLCGGKARYTQYPMVFFPDTPDGYREQAERFLGAEKIEMPPEFQYNARRFLYYQLFRASLSFEKFLEEGDRKGYVRLRSFSWSDLMPENSPAVQAILAGVKGEHPDDGVATDGRHTFLLKETA